MTSDIPRALPIRPRPITGEGTLSYVRRLARANHLRFAHLRRCLSQPDSPQSISIEWLAALSGRSREALERALPELTDQGPGHIARTHHRERQKPALFALIRREAREGELSIRALADRQGVHRRIIRQALASPIPVPRKRFTRSSKLDPYNEVPRTSRTRDPIGF